MPTTTTSSWHRVSNGEITTHNPQSIAPTTRDILIQSAEVQWEGIDKTVTETETDFNANEDSDESIGDGGFAVNEAFADFPPVPSGCSFDYHEVGLQLANLSNTWAAPYNWAEVGRTAGDYDIVDMYWEDQDGGSIPAGQTNYPLGLTSVFEGREVHTNYVGETVRGSISRPELEHPGNDPEFIEITVRTLTIGTRQVSNTYSTQNPRVTHDVFGESGSITLSDGEQSNWYTLSDLQADAEDFYHDIGGSGEARFRFRFTWEYAYPEPVNGLVGFWDESAGVWRECAVADPTDSLLEYTHVTVYNAATGNWGALDVVDPAHDRAIGGWEFYDPDVGWLAPREYDTTAA